MTGYEFGHLSLADLRSMLLDVLFSDPAPSDKEFVKALANEIDKRQREGPLDNKSVIDK